MRRVATIVVVFCGIVLCGGWGGQGRAGEPRPASPVKLYRGQIKSVKIDRCGLQPGTCEGSVILEQPGGQSVVLAIQPGTWLKRGDQLILIDELGVGNYVTVQAAPVPAAPSGPGQVGSSPGERILTLEETTGD